MILLDMSNILMGTIHSVVEHIGVWDETAYRQSVLHKIGHMKKNHGKKFGKMIICVDDKDAYWRQDLFPHYKCRRRINTKKQREISDLDWDEVFNVIDSFINELDTYLPWKVMRVPNCEADDIIGTLTLNTSEDTLIISRDHDFKQLQSRGNVKQLDPASGKMVIEKDPLAYLQEHIIRGDSGDDIPNILSPADSFATGTRQKSVYTKVIVDWIGKDIKQFAETPIMIDRYKLNKKLIDLSCIPEEYKEKILTEYNRENTGRNGMVFDYFVDYNLVNLLDTIQIYMEK